VDALKDGNSRTEEEVNRLKATEQDLEQKHEESEMVLKTITEVVASNETVLSRRGRMNEKLRKDLMDGRKGLRNQFFFLDGRKGLRNQYSPYYARSLYFHSSLILKRAIIGLFTGIISMTFEI